VPWVSVGRARVSHRTGHGRPRGRSVYRNTDLKSATSIGLRLDADTLSWWLHPDRQTGRAALFGPDAATPLPIREGLGDLGRDPDVRLA